MPHNRAPIVADGGVQLPATTSAAALATDASGNLISGSGIGALYQLAAGVSYTAAANALAVWENSISSSEPSGVFLDVQGILSELPAKYVTPQATVQPVPGTFAIGGDSIASINQSDYPLWGGPTGGTDIASRLAYRNDVLWGVGYTTATSTNPAAGWAHWAEALSGGKMRMIKNAGVTGSSLATQYKSMQDPTSPYYITGLNPQPGIFIWEGAGGDDNGVLSIDQATYYLQLIYELLLSTFPNSIICVCTQTPTSPNDDAWRRPINTWIREYCKQRPLRLIDFENVMMNPSTGLVQSNVQNGFTQGATTYTFTMTIANPAVFTTGLPHGLQAGNLVQFITTGALPTGITAYTTYYVISSGLTSTTFQISAIAGGAALATSGSQSGNHTLLSNISMSGDFLHPNATGSYYLAKEILRCVGDVLPDSNDLINDYSSDTRVQPGVGGWTTDALMNGTLGAGQLATNWGVTGGGVVELIERDDNYGNWQRLRIPAGTTTPTQYAIYKSYGAMPGGAIIHLECEVRIPFADWENVTDFALYLSTNQGATCYALFLQTQGPVPVLFPYANPTPGERWVLRTTPIIIPVGGVTSAFGNFAQVYITGTAGTIDIGRFSWVRDDVS